MSKAIVIGAGLAGSEAAWQLARRGVDVTLVEMRPENESPAHHTGQFAELVCSNSLRGAALSTAPGLLKEELRRTGSLIMECADQCAIPAGGALAVDRERFSKMVTERLCAPPRVTVVRERINEIPQGNVIVASGPLTEGALADSISRALGQSAPLHFYDAAAPIVSFASIDMDKAFFASRYGKGTADYINCPLSREEYDAFWRELCAAQEAPVHGFEDAGVFEGCMPVEVMARRGQQTLAFGPLKPRGLPDPRTGKEPYAVVQLRRDNAQGTIYNIVGFQTHLKWPEQRRVFSMIPGLEHAQFVRYGVMHRNTFLDSPRLLDRYYRVRGQERLMFAGQITGVEGYVESTASGALAAMELSRRLTGRAPIDFPRETAMGALALYISDPSVVNFQPMNINFGLIPPLDHRVKGKRNKNAEISQRALEKLEELDLS